MNVPNKRIIKFRQVVIDDIIHVEFKTFWGWIRFDEVIGGGMGGNTYADVKFKYFPEITKRILKDSPFKDELLTLIEYPSICIYNFNK